MTLPGGRARRSSWSWLALLALGACVPATSVVAPPPAREVPRLEARVDARPDEMESRILLGAAYQAAGRTGDAISTLEDSEAVRAGNPSAVLYLGLAYEDAERFEDARRTYRRFLETSRPEGRIRDQMEGRIELLRRQELARAVQEALTREQELADVLPSPGTVAVFPFLVRTDDPDLEPLGRAVAALVVSDLARLDRLTVVERANIDVLLDELTLAEEGWVDPGTGARSGRILGARHVVQADLVGGRASLDMDGAVVELERQAESVARVGAEGSLDRIFEMQKEILFDVVDALGINLTAAEREALSERATSNVMALLEYGRGLDAEAQGRWQAAAEHFRAAAALDPAFAMASSAVSGVAAAAGAVGLETAEILRSLSPADVMMLVNELGALVNVAGIRDPAQEVLGVEGVGGGSLTMELILLPPSGG